MANDIKLQEGHPVDENLRPIKVGGKSTALEVAQHGTGARISGDLEISGDITGGVTTDSLTTNSIISTGLTVDSSGNITLEALDSVYLANAGTNTVDFSTKGSTAAGAYMKFMSILDDSDYFMIDTTTLGATTITTVDDGGEEADLTLNIDGKIDINSATGEDIILDSGTDLSIDRGRDMIVTVGRHLDFAITGEIDFNTATAGFTAQAATGDGTTTIDWTAGNKFHLLFAASTNEVVTFGTNPTNPCNLILKLKQPSSGAGSTIDWVVSSGTIYWAGGGSEDTDEPTLSTGVNDVDILSFYFDGTNYYGVASLGFDA